MKKALPFIVAVSLLFPIGSKVQAQVDSLAVSFDIKPAECPNPVNTRSHGVLPAAILGTSDFDVTQIDLTSLLVDNVPPTRWSEEDVAAPSPFTGALTECTDCTDKGPDGFMDLTLKFDTQALVKALNLNSDGDAKIATLTGHLKDGTPIKGQDVICVLKKKTDFDGNGKVDFSDFISFAGGFGKKKGQSKFDDKFDLDGDGLVGFSDFLEFAATFGSSGK